MAWLYIVAALLLIGGIIMEFFAIARAPLGYQDETGFHPGVKQQPDEDDYRGPNAN